MGMNVRYGTNILQTRIRKQAMKTELMNRFESYEGLVSSLLELFILHDFISSSYHRVKVHPRARRCSHFDGVEDFGFGFSPLRKPRASETETSLVSWVVVRRGDPLLLLA
ncbi:hypothetical protein CIPAW_07G164800 [Carya illinoinensis]|uniref:Uncharacterized protein n=1 Tax=Carya illinoinensis TaxID=32201 RepID=A0A8T1PZZ7_CARIL|nr:hypothetical protein CIPAW_07G164800 [Carya illinoinensis]